MKEFYITFVVVAVASGVFAEEGVATKQTSLFNVSEKKEDRVFVRGTEDSLLSERIAAAKNGDVDAAFDLYQYYWRKHAHLEEEANRWLSFAAGNGHEEAWILIAARREGNGESPDQSYVRAAKKGLKIGIDYIAARYLYGGGDCSWITRGVELLEEISAKGHGYAAIRLGEFYESPVADEIEKKDLGKAREWYLKALELGRDDACIFLAKLCLKNQKTEDAHNWLVKAQSPKMKVLPVNYYSRIAVNLMQIPGDEFMSEAREVIKKGLEVQKYREPMTFFLAKDLGIELE